MLGLGSAGLNVSRANAGSELEDVGSGAGLLRGPLWCPIQPQFSNFGARLVSSGGLLSTGVKNLLSQLGF